MSIRIAIAEDQRLVRELIAALLRGEPDFAVVGEAGNADAAISIVHATEPDVLVLDISSPLMAGIELTRRLRKDDKQLKVLAISVLAEAAVVRKMFQAGANGYFVKSAPPAELVRAIRVVMRNSLYLPPALTDEGRDDGTPPIPEAPLLGDREQQVLALLANGKRSIEIAAALRISVGTVEVHRRNIMRKLDLHSVAELTRYAIQQGLTPL